MDVAHATILAATGLPTITERPAASNFASAVGFDTLSKMIMAVLLADGILAGAPMLIVFGLFAAWAALTLWLFRRLKYDHPATYEAIGSPGFLKKNSPRSAWLFLVFLWSSCSRELGDPTLVFVVVVMRVVLVVYFLFFAVMLVAFYLKLPPFEVEQLYVQAKCCGLRHVIARAGCRC